MKLDGRTLYRIKACVTFDTTDGNTVKAGTLGGWVEREENLSHAGMAWIADNAIVYGNARVYGNAIVGDEAIVYGNAIVYGDAMICDKAIVSGDTRVSGYTIVYDNAMICDNAVVSGDARFGGNAIVCGNAIVSGEARVNGCAIVCDNAIVSGDTVVSGSAVVCDKAGVKICGNTLVDKDAFVGSTTIMTLSELMKFLDLENVMHVVFDSDERILNGFHSETFIYFGMGEFVDMVNDEREFGCIGINKVSLSAVPERFDDGYTSDLELVMIINDDDMELLLSLKKC